MNFCYCDLELSFDIIKITFGDFMMFNLIPLEKKEDS